MTLMRTVVTVLILTQMLLLDEAIVGDTDSGEDHNNTITTLTNRWWET